MAHRITFTGQAGEIRWGYRPVAALASWTLDADATGGALTGSLSASADNAFWVSQQPLRFVVPRPTGAWTWPIESLQVADRQVTARLGHPQE